MSPPFTASRIFQAFPLIQTSGSYFFSFWVRIFMSSDFASSSPWTILSSRLTQCDLTVETQGCLSSIMLLSSSVSSLTALSPPGPGFTSWMNTTSGASREIVSATNVNRLEPFASSCFDHNLCCTTPPVEKSARFQVMTLSSARCSLSTSGPFFASSAIRPRLLRSSCTFGNLMIPVSPERELAFESSAMSLEIGACRKSRRAHPAYPAATIATTTTNPE